MISKTHGVPELISTSVGTVEEVYLPLHPPFLFALLLSLYILHFQLSKRSVEQISHHVF
jgi:hypothetical protein